MKKLTTIVLLTGLSIGLSLIMASCGGHGGSSGVYRHHHGHGPWWGSRGYYGDRIIVVPDRDPDVVATPLPSGPEHMPDMGMPDIGGDFGGDMGGDW